MTSGIYLYFFGDFVFISLNLYSCVWSPTSTGRVQFFLHEMGSGYWTRFNFIINSNEPLTHLTFSKLSTSCVSRYKWSCSNCTALSLDKVSVHFWNCLQIHWMINSVCTGGSSRVRKRKKLLLLHRHKATLQSLDTKLCNVHYDTVFLLQKRQVYTII